MLESVCAGKDLIVRGECMYSVVYCCNEAFCVMLLVYE